MALSKGSEPRGANGEAAEGLTDRSFAERIGYSAAGARPIW